MDISRPIKNFVVSFCNWREIAAQFIHVYYWPWTQLKNVAREMKSNLSSSYFIVVADEVRQCKILNIKVISVLYCDNKLFFITI